MLLGFGTGLAVYALACGSAPVVTTQSAILCHQKGLALAAKAATCNDGLIAIENLIATDPDCVAIYQGRSSGLHCLLDDGGPGGQ